ncbi:DegT/DnrJ/EryC1/StrS aminotransferase family protein [Micromonospora sp. KC721]|uniref:DegT/DnrJ/EryC1/StrS family aminotransferase n=1 Tax=Micromonospora sp. KC721 TaxID=2530380 RepID=UPI001049C666|nr:DegT/DnrJ/EryC1/StrS family aminotransferase [Micromonospora sp. KC721]TDB82453.1 DegT/DnrJ/EryC1/StrS family aminotransferase [Micromonospora sp. KC721]
MGTAVDTGRLAVNGGPAVRPADRPWPVWPVPAPEAGRYLQEVLHSRRWAISSPHHGDLFERRFAREFADYLGARHCVPTDHGSSALVVALESLGLEHGDPVLVPALTWAASATAVLRAGLLPVLADVDRETGCLDAAAVRDEPNVRAVVVVHWAATMADVPAISAVADGRGCAVIEDAAQAHGARWLGRAAGTLGRLGCFSMQHSKVLTSGEGGAVVTDDDALAGRLEELRADSRRYRDDPREGELDLRETATVMGANFCLSEFAAALLCAQLPLLDEQHAVRNRNYDRLAEFLADVPSVRLLRRRPEQDQLSLYEVPIVFDRLPAGMDNAWAAAALTAELGMRAYPPRPPLPRSPLLRPWTKPALAPLTERFVARHRGRTFPGADHLASHSVLLHHSAFLGDEQDMADVAAAVAKVAGAA